MSDRFEITEVCPHCDREVTMTWDVNEDGFKAYCPFCGKILMLCDECMHRTGECINDCDFCWDDDTHTCGHCRFNPRENAETIYNKESLNAFCVMDALKELRFSLTEVYLRDTDKETIEYLKEILRGKIKIEMLIAAIKSYEDIYKNTPMEETAKNTISFLNERIAEFEYIACDFESLHLSCKFFDSSKSADGYGCSHPDCESTGVNSCTGEKEYGCYCSNCPLGNRAESEDFDELACKVDWCGYCKESLEGDDVILLPAFDFADEVGKEVLSRYDRFIYRFNKEYLDKHPLYTAKESEGNSND